MSILDWEEEHGWWQLRHSFNFCLHKTITSKKSWGHIQWAKLPSAGATFQHGSVTSLNIEILTWHSVCYSYCAPVNSRDGWSSTTPLNFRSHGMHYTVLHWLFNNFLNITNMVNIKIKWIFVCTWRGTSTFERLSVFNQLLSTETVNWSWPFEGVNGVSGHGRFMGSTKIIKGLGWDQKRKNYQEREGMGELTESRGSQWLSIMAS